MLLLAKNSILINESILFGGVIRGDFMGKQKTKKGKTKINIFHILLILSLCALIFFVGTFNVQEKTITLETEGIAKLDSINSALQRVTKLELENNQNEELLTEIEVMMQDVIAPNGDFKYFTKIYERSNLLLLYESEYTKLIDAILEFRINGNRDSLFVASEHHYSFSAEVSTELGNYMAELSVARTKTITALLVNGVFVALFFVISLKDIVLELKKNKELSEEMYIDTATGVYNRAKCQEVLKRTMSPENTKERGIIIFDLNDLKKTNDNLGHRAGDDLISSFAAQLKEATRVSTDEIFVGRYGGDEFIAYLDSVEESDVKRYLEEVEFLLQEFNATQGKPFQLSCAAGYSITNDDTRHRTMRELFDEADVRMYQNKIEMKKRKKEELERQGIVVEEVADSRL